MDLPHVLRHLKHLPRPDCRDHTLAGAAATFEPHRYRETLWHGAQPGRRTDQDVGDVGAGVRRRRDHLNLDATIRLPACVAPRVMCVCARGQGERETHEGKAASRRHVSAPLTDLPGLPSLAMRMPGSPSRSSLDAGFGTPLIACHAESVAPQGGMLHV